MINITRSTQVPASLDTPEIRQYIADAQQYLHDLQAHTDDPVAHPVKPTPPNKPASYRSSDLLAAFDRDFHAKCYLTEEAFANSWAMDVEHFIPQSERSDLRYAWENLLPATHQANTIKPRNTPPGGYLNPCDPADDVETEIWYSLAQPMGHEPHFEAKDPQNIKAVNTARLLIRVHNGHDDNTRKGTATLRLAIQKRYNEILLKIIEWQGCQPGTQAKHQAERDLKGFLSRKASFTMLMRSMPAVQQCVPPSFLD